MIAAHTGGEPPNSTPQAVRSVAVAASQWHSNDMICGGRLLRPERDHTASGEVCQPQSAAKRTRPAQLLIDTLIEGQLRDLGPLKFQLVDAPQMNRS